jgi:hypothetical protein
MTSDEFLGFPKQIEKELIEMNDIVPVIVGEWSLGARSYEFNGTRAEFERAFADSQLEIYNKLSGWVFWSYKITTYDSGWNFRSLVERNILHL